MRELLARLRSAWRAVRRGSQLDAEMHEEMRCHVEMQTERLMRERGLDRIEARRQAFVAFGGVEKFKEEGREVRGVQWVDRISLDVRLGVRMLVKYPLLTLVGGFAMAVAIAIGATFFEVISEVLNPAIALEEGDRVVALQDATNTPGQPQRRVLHDFLAWRDELRSVQQVSAFRNVDRNLASGSLDPEPVQVAEMTASGFAVARKAPLLGRYLVPDDERDGSLPVVVIGFDAWHRRFAGDPAIVGRTITLGAVPHTVVGVMPQGFAFPVDHQFWTALRTNPSASQRLQGPALFVFGRLAPKVGLEAAQAELTAIGQRAETADPEGYGRLRLTVLPFTREHVEIDRPQIVWALRLVQLLLAALLVVVAVNLAILVYARTVTRLGEIAVRSALGASRRRILAQLFMEALALSSFGAATGLLLSQFLLGWLQSMVVAVENVPFWITFELTLGTIGYAFALAVLAALIVGVLPGLKTTGRQLLTPLRALGGSTGMHLGATWTALIVAQVAIAVAVLPAAVFTVSEVVRMEISGPGFPAEQFVIAKVDVREAEANASGTVREAIGAQARARQLALRARVEAEPGVSAVALSSGVPGFEGGHNIVFDDADAVRAGSAEVNVLRVEPGIFDVYGARVLAGRTLVAGDADTADQAVVVNHSFVRLLLGDRPGTGPTIRTAQVFERFGGGSGSISRRRGRRRFSSLRARTRQPRAADDVPRRRSGHDASSRDDDSLQRSRAFRCRGAATPDWRRRRHRASPSRRHAPDRVLQPESGAVAFHFVGARAGDGERALSLGGGHLCVDVVHGRATHARDRHPHGAGGTSASDSAERVRTRPLAAGAGRPYRIDCCECNVGELGSRPHAFGCAPRGGERGDLDGSAPGGHRARASRVAHPGDRRTPVRHVTSGVRSAFRSLHQPDVPAVEPLKLPAAAPSFRGHFTHQPRAPIDDESGIVGNLDRRQLRDLVGGQSLTGLFGQLFHHAQERRLLSDVDHHAIQAEIGLRVVGRGRDQHRRCQHRRDEPLKDLATGFGNLADGIAHG